MSQTKYVKNLIKRFDLDGAKHTKIPINTILRLTRGDARTHIEHRSYHALIDSLLFLTTSRLNISFSVGVYTWF